MCFIRLTKKPEPTQKEKQNPELSAAAIILHPRILSIWPLEVYSPVSCKTRRFGGMHQHFYQKSNFHLTPIFRDFEKASVKAKKIKPQANTTTCIKFLEDLICKISNYWKLIRIIAYCLRFVINLRLRATERCSGSITLKEFNNALHHILKIVQEAEFSAEINHLRRKGHLKKNHPLLPLGVFLNKDG